MTTKEFTNEILNHKTGFVLSTGDANGECFPSCGMNTVFFDGATLIKSAYDSNWLDFSNGKSKGLGTAYICLGDVQKVTEHNTYTHSDHRTKFKMIDSVQGLFDLG